MSSILEYSFADADVGFFSRSFSREDFLLNDDEQYMRANVN